MLSDSYNQKDDGRTQVWSKNCRAKPKSLCVFELVLRLGSQHNSATHRMDKKGFLHRFGLTEVAEIEVNSM